MSDISKFKVGNDTYNIKDEESRNTSPTTVTGNPITLEDGIDLPARNVTVTIEPSQEGTGDPSPENVRPLIGFDEVDVDVCGKNLTVATSDPSNPDLGFSSSGGGTAAMQYDATNGGYYTVGHRMFAYIAKQSGTYTLSLYAKARSEGGSAYGILGKTGSKFPSYANQYTNDYVRYSTTWTINKGETIYINIYDTIYIKDMQLEIAETATDYEPYNPNSKTTTVQLGRTVYGGVLDVTNGKLTVTWKADDLGTLPWQYDSGNAVFCVNGIGAKRIPETIKPIYCPIYATMAEGITDNFGNISRSTSPYELYIKNTAYIDAVTFKAAMSGVMLTYELATPEVIDLTPTEIDMLLGYNTITTNGTTLSLVYQPNNVLGVAEKYTDEKVAVKVDKIEGKGLSTNDYTDEDKAIVGGVTGALAEKADTEDIPDLVSDNLAKGILGNETVLSTDTAPFVSKTMSAGKYQRKKFVGCSFVWNQLVDSDTESVTIASGHKYALYQNGAWSIGASSGTAIAVTGGSDLLTDLTQLFGSTAIADYIYNLEQATAGAGVAKLKELGFFTEDYYAYDAGSVQSVDIKEYKVTKDNIVTTYPLTPTELRGVPKIDANNNIYCDGDEYASDGEVTRKYGIVDLGELTWTSNNSGFFGSSVSGLKGISNTQFPNAICAKYTCLPANGVAGNDKSIAVGLNNVNGLYAHDNTYTSAEDFKTAMSGVYLVYEKDTPTTETLTPFDYPQSVGSLEEITDYKVEQEQRDVAIPTGHVTEYMGKGGEFTLPTLPNTPSVLAYDGHNFFWKPETT